MQSFIALPCPSCYRKLDTFRLSANAAAVTLQTTCEPCTTIVEVDLTYADLRDLSAGLTIAVSPLAEPEPKFVM
jgi:hypothetical protein